MLLCWNGVVLEWRCVGMALCRNGDMSGNIVVNDKISADEQSDDPRGCSQKKKKKKKKKVCSTNTVIIT